MISKMHPYAEGSDNQPGSKIAIVFHGPPLFSGDAGYSIARLEEYRSARITAAVTGQIRELL